MRDSIATSSLYFSAKGYNYVLGVTTLSLAILSIPFLFSDYHPSPTSTLKHSLFVLSIVASAAMLLTEKTIDACRSLYVRIELGLFDRMQYVLAAKMETLVNTFRRTHTGNLNINMLGFILFFLISLFIMHFTLT